MSKAMIRFSLTLLFGLLIVVTNSEAAGGHHKGGGGTPQITGITLSNNTFPGGSSSGTVVGAITVQETAQAFAGTVTLVTSGGSCSGGDTSHFQILGSGPWNLATNGIVATGSYTVCIQASQTGIVGSPFTQSPALTITGTTSILSVSLSNNNFLGGSSTGTIVGDVTVALSSGGFTGTIALVSSGGSCSGGDTSHFHIVGSSPWHLETLGIVASGSYTVCVQATQAGAIGSPATQTESITGIVPPNQNLFVLDGTNTFESAIPAGPIVPQTIASITLPGGNTFVGGSSSGTVISSISVTMSPSSPTFSGTRSLVTSGGSCSGGDVTDFQIVGSNLETNGVVPAGPYTVCIQATQGGIGNSPFTQTESLTGTGTQTLSSIALSNSATTTGLSSGTAVGTLSVTMSSPSTPIFAHYSSGGLTLTPTVGGCNGADNSSFQIVNDQLETNGTLTAGTKNICVAATQAGAIGSPLKQNFAITVGNLIDAAAGVGTGGCAGSGTSGSPWNNLCIQNAVNSAVTGDTVFLRGGNWALPTYNASFTGSISGTTLTVSGVTGTIAIGQLVQNLAFSVAGGTTITGGSGTTWTVNVPQSVSSSTMYSGNNVSVLNSINFVGASSGNTLDAYGHINNGSGTSPCPILGSSITCVKATGNTPQSGNFLPGGYIRFGADGAAAPNCVNVNISRIYFDGSTASSGGDFHGILSIENCPGPITVSDIGVLTYGFTGASTSCPGPITTCANTETQFFAQGITNLLVQNSFLGLPLYQGVYQAGQAFESVINSGITLKNNLFWGGVYNPTDDDSVVFTGNVTDMSGQGGNVSLSPAFGPTGCGLNPGNIGGHQCGGNNGNTGTFHATFSNNYNLDSNSAHPGFGFGPGVNDPTTNGNVSDVHYTGNWLVGGTVAITTCEWDIFPEHGNCASGGMSVNAQATGVSPNECSVFTSNGDAFEIANNSIIGSTAAEINAQPSGTTRCYSTSGAQDVTLKAFGFNAQKNYLNSPSNQYNTNANAISPVQSGNFCVGGVGTVSGCATSGFTSLPTASFTLNPLGLSNIVPFNTTTFTAQYGAVKWLSSTSPTTPTSGGQAGTGASWSFTPPVSLSATHGDTVYMWTMDSANNISTAHSVLVP